MESETNRLPIARMLIVVVGVATVTAVVVTFVQKLLTGDVNPALTAGITGAITGVAGSNELRRKPACEDSAS